MFRSPHPARHPARATAAVLGVAGLVTLGAAPAATAADGEADLAVGGVTSVDGAKPGSTLPLSPTVTNSGTTATGKVVLSFWVTRGLEYTSVPSNCHTYKAFGYDEAPTTWEEYCEFDRTIRPGKVYGLEKPLSVKVLKRALQDDLGVIVSDGALPGDGDGETTTPVRGTAPAVRLVEKPDGETEQLQGPGTVNSDNTADFKVTGARLKGDIGDTVPVTVSFKNAGPAWVQDSDDTPVDVVRIEPPAGTSIVGHPEFCDAKDGVYFCGKGNGWMDDGESVDYSFKLRIDHKVPGARGSVVLTDWDRPFDTNKADDKADIILAWSESGEGSGNDAALPVAGAALAVGAGVVALVRRRGGRTSRG